jgi:hypothetical protein
VIVAGDSGVELRYRDGRRVKLKRD